MPKPKPAARRSNVADHEYNPETRQLTVTFHQGRKYRYDDVHPATAAKLKKADSVGSFLHSHIIGKHDATCLFDD